MSKKTIIEISLILLLFLMSVSFLFAQQKETNYKIEPETLVEITNCHSNHSYLSILSQSLKPNELVIIISHKGKSEKKSFGKRRLHNAKNFILMSRSSTNQSIEALITAEGEEVIGKGYLDFFVSGKLNLRIYFKKNQDLAVPPCVVTSPEEKPCSTDLEKLFYPCKKKSR